MTPSSLLAHHVLGDDARHCDGQAGRGREEGRERAGRQQRGQQVTPDRTDHPRGQLEHHAVRSAGADQVGRVEPAERGVHRRQHVEEAEQPEHRDRGLARCLAVGVGVEAHHHVRQPHRAEEGRDHQGVRRVQRVVAREVDRVRPGRAGLAAHEQARVRRRTSAVAQPHDDEEEERQRQREELQPVLERLDEGDRAHPARQHVEEYDDRDEQPAGPTRQAGRQAHGDTGALQLRHHVEPADRHHHHRCDRAHRARVEPGLGEVGQRVGTRPTQRGGHEHQQHEVSGGPADRVPEHLGPEGDQESRDPEEGRSGEVLAADRRRVQAGSHRARGNEEVGGGPAEPQPPGSDHERGHGDQQHRHEAEREVHDRSTTRAKARSLRSARRT